ncbi:MAG: iron ABC transporter permease [Dehalococcoidales bacterium]|jgi:iron complex transport system permease protein
MKNKVGGLFFTKEQMTGNQEPKAGKPGIKYKILFVNWKEHIADKWPILLVFPVLAFLVSFSIGKFPISIPDLLHTLFYHFVDPAKIANANMETVLFNIRLPRVLTVLIVGGGLSMAGASFQGMFKNPLVSPDILGASAGAAFGACVAMLLDMPSAFVQLFSFCSGILAVTIATNATKKFSRDPILGLVLGGIMIGSLFSAGTSALKILADAVDKLPQITFWLMGSFNTINTTKFLSILLPMAISFIILFSVRWHLNVLSFGEEEAKSLGVKTERIRRLTIIASTLITASSVSISGMVGWIGLVIPHMGRALVGPNFKRLIPTCLILGSTFLLIVDDIARCTFTVELPIGILMSFVGVPFFYFIYKYRAKGESGA